MIFFPKEYRSAFGYNSGYYSEDLLENGKGYWIKYPESKTIEVHGTESDSLLSLTPGWNIVGVHNFPVSAEEIYAIPGNPLISDFFGYMDGYFTADTLYPGKGYWVKVSRNGTLKMDSLSYPPGDNDLYSREKINPNWPKLIIEDTKGRKSRLYFSDKVVSRDDFILPPVPPAGVFDVRFSDDSYVSGPSGLTEIYINSEDFPLIIKSEGKNFKIKNKFGDESINTTLQKWRSNCIIRSGGYSSEFN